MVEGPGHIPMHLVAMNIERQMKVCDEAPFYVLGPLVTDIAPGYDHITSAIGAAIAGQAGAAMLCYVTPKEHLGLPNKDDVRQGVIAYKISAHAAGHCTRTSRRTRPRRCPLTRSFQLRVGKAIRTQPRSRNRTLNARRRAADEAFKDAKFCSMCGPKFCSMRITQTMRQYADGTRAPIEGEPSIGFEPKADTIQLPVVTSS
jgi:phosphomethylpyrimidine synthase